MLQIKNISKQYVTGGFTQNALNNVSFNLRDNEFVAILGPSGSGKTTLLNIIGGLDRYDSGDLIINGISTEKYKDRDWDSYRNHTIGFVFQSYNLIPHQSVLANVELALTISGVSKAERRKRAKEALEKVGLGNHLKKRPNQMSGGQMQRVAIARALVNDPDILLADEPTGALDSETSLQVMELLKEVAKDRLVVMVTHNADLADEYATRIIRLKDGIITDDTAPYSVDEGKLEPPQHKNMGHSSMSFFTALSLSFNNLKTKKGRTILTAFAGSIGIIGIALILSLSTGVNNYIVDIQKETMLSYPITISETTIDLSGLISARADKDYSVTDHELDAVYSDSKMLEAASAMTTSITENNLTEFKKYIDNPESKIHEYIGQTGIIYSYSTDFDIYTYDDDGLLINTDGSTLAGKRSIATSSSMASMFGVATSIFEEMLPGKDELVSTAVTESYDVLYGKFPEKWDEAVIVVNNNNEILATVMCQLGLMPTAEYKEITTKLMSGEEVEVNETVLSYKDICNKVYTVIPVCERYVKKDNGTFSFVEEESDDFNELMENGIKLKIVGVIKAKEDASAANITGIIAYTKALTDKVIEMTDESQVVTAQRNEPDINVISGLSFSPSNDESKAEDAKKYLESLNISDKAAVCLTLMKSMYGENEQMLLSFESMGEAELAATLDQYLMNPQQDVLISIYDTFISTGTYEDNMKAFGVISRDAPSSIAIYVDSFEDKDGVNECIRLYNESAAEEDKITYTDYIGLLLSSVTTIVTTISYVLIAFVSVSLVVSSIMIGIITFISVLERTKEIGILRAIGASKRNVSQVFNAETFIIGLFSGLIGIGITELILIPTNVLVHIIGNNPDVNASLPLSGAIVLVALSMFLTIIAGLIPSKKAAKQDPVTALRSE